MEAVRSDTAGIAPGPDPDFAYLPGAIIVFAGHSNVESGSNTQLKLPTSEILTAAFKPA
ncbi:hypothetical protein CSKR_200710 [Clonorchis sinensis]|uniref:Uncharacterized protein n=1 Tax=Clonorchis sinensis TaxID=79923 RepID=A0A8T1MFY3_CLOSI|nr:hypothetical protein CSKR_200710 [Clonorchis sinensis]